MMDYDKILKLVELCKVVSVFQFEDLLILGERVHVVKTYVKESPNKKFRTWLIDNYKIIK